MNHIHGRITILKCKFSLARFEKKICMKMTMVAEHFIASDDIRVICNIDAN